MVSEPVQSLIDILHEDVRDDAWAQRLAEAHAGLMETIPQGEGVEKTQILREVLRQHVDEGILPDVYRAAATPDSAGFVQGLTTELTDPTTGEVRIPAQSWATGLSPFTDEELEAEGLRNALGNDSQPDAFERQLQDASRNADFDTTLQLLMALNNREPEPEVDIPYHDTGVGETLSKYINDALYEANRNSSFTEGFVPPGGTVGDAGVLGGLSGEQRLAMLEAKILEDIQNGDFPVGNFDPENAADITSAIIAKLAPVFEDRPESYSRGTSSYHDNITYHFHMNDDHLDAAIDSMFVGDEPLFNTNMQAGLSSSEYAEIFKDIMYEKGHAMSVSDLEEEFTRRIDGYTNPQTGEFVPPTMEMPDHMREQFFDDVGTFYGQARSGDLKSDTPDVFGDLMAEKYQFFDADYVQAPMNTQALDYGEPLRMTLGAETERGFEVVDGNGQVMFEITLDDGFAMYSADGTGEGFSFDDLGTIESKTQLREMLGDGFMIRSASPLDAGLDGTDAGLSGYHITAIGSDNAFHVGFDAIPESGVSEEFRELRNASIDNQDVTPEAPTPDIAMGNENYRPSASQLGLG